MTLARIYWSKDFKLHAEMILITQFVRSFRFAIIYTKSFQAYIYSLRSNSLAHGQFLSLLDRIISFTLTNQKRLQIQRKHVKVTYNLASLIVHKMRYHVVYSLSLSLYLRGITRPLRVNLMSLVGEKFNIFDDIH